MLRAASTYARTAAPKRVHPVPKDQRVRRRPDARVFGENSRPRLLLGCLGWRKAGVDKPLLLVIVRPVGYRLRNGSKLLYRERHS